tara:strand:+ start:16295 stop:19672 length:3378 start_codon:yes stop_codon:yes gene_type:complete
MNVLNPEPIRSKPRGVALLTTLVLASMMAMIVIAFLVSMRLELGSAAAYEQTQSAKVLSQSALSHGIELLRTNIPEPARISEATSEADAELWVTNPGRLTIIQGNGEPRYVDLHTGAVTEDPGNGAERDLDSVDLNRPLAGEEFPPITVALDERGMPDPDAERPEMRVRWHNVLRDPSQAAAKENPIVGRYAFWMDDESGKLNFNVAGGKTALGEEDNEGFHEQLATGMMPPLFNLGSDRILYQQAGQRRAWALGRPRSVNLDVLADDPSELDVEGLLEQAWLNGFSRYPEAIMDFVQTSDPVEWYHLRKYNLTFYSRSPEFNVFGRSRFFTTKIPLSLEGGPNYQLPFVYGSNLERPEDGPLHLHALMSLGLAKDVEDEDKSDVELRAHNVVNQGQVEMLMGYMRRKWPGYSQSFVDKYGEKECYQMALSIVLWPRIALDESIHSNQNAYLQRTTSAVYAPPIEERPGAYPERHFWRFNVGGEEVLMLPQQPGPHITEVRLKFELEDAGTPETYRVKFKYESEYYMHPFGTQTQLNKFPMKVDYLKIEPEGESAWEVGTTDPDSTDLDRSWYQQNKNEPYSDSDWNTRLNRLAASGGTTWLGPSNTASNNRSNRRVVGSTARYVGKTDAVVPANASDAREFNLSGGELSLDFKIRLGMTTSSNPLRPRQMIPMGDTDRDEHVLDGTVELSEFEREKYVTFYIQDPRLSALKDAWVRLDDDEGTLGQANPGEPLEQSSEKSKFRFYSCGRGSIKSVISEDRNFPLHLGSYGNEFASNSPVSSIGFWSMLHTGIQSNAPWRTLNLGPTSTQISDNPPDAVLLDLFGSTYPMQNEQWEIDATLPDEFSTVSFMNSTAGQVNLNTRVYPQSPWFQAPERKKPLEAVFKHLRPDEDVDELVDNIIENQTDERFFRYVGELAEIDGYERSDAYPGYPGDDEEEEKSDEPTRFEKEELLRNMAGCLTTKSNTFSLWGVAQVVSKQPHSGDSPSYGEFELGDSVRSEKRFFALIERYIWPGKDGVPGNAHLASDGTWDRISTPTTPAGNSDGDRLYNLPGSPPQTAPSGGRRGLNREGTHPEYDGPEEVGMDPYTQKALGTVPWTHSDLADAYNPPQPVIKYRVIYFKYLDS